MQYICNHVVLPPELPQADDSTVAHEKGLARAMLDSITSFRLVVKDEVAHQVLTAVTSILKGAIKVTSSTGAIDRETLVLVLKNLTDNGKYPIQNMLHFNTNKYSRSCTSVHQSAECWTLAHQHEWLSGDRGIRAVTC